MFPIFSLFIFAVLSHYNSNFCRADPIYTPEVKFAEPNAYPFVVSIFRKGKIEIMLRSYYSHICGGALVTRKHVVTAAHCFERGTLLAHYKVRVGTNDLQSGTVHKIKCRLGYDEWAIQTNNILEYHHNDITVIELKKLVSSGIKPAKISSTPIDTLYGTKVKTAGWGIISDNTLPKNMIEAELNIISREKCIDNINNATLYKGPFSFQENQFCTNGDPYAVLDCGNSGSPVFIGDDEIIGINNSICPTKAEFNGKVSKDQQNLHLEVRRYLNFLNDVTNNFTTEKSWPYPCLFLK